MNLKTILAASAAIAALGTASAAVFVTGHTGTVNDSNTASAGTVGIEFFPHQDGVVIDTLGVFAPNGTGGATLQISLWDASGSTALATVGISGTSSDADSDGFIYASITPVSVAQNNPYMLAVTGYTTSGIGDETLGDATPTYNNVVTWVISSYFWDGGSGNPELSKNNPTSSRFTVASFTTSAVPEPEVYASVAGLALVGYGLYRRQVRK
ncbi:MAG TPA: hypothetical protein VMB21_13885 [Candidatus Limnocylindria bacterium]|jgi:hypothetical protein|nr:hypothetical protein [Candidatus Limnocylindria bacterium]